MFIKLSDVDFKNIKELLSSNKMVRVTKDVTYSQVLNKITPNISDICVKDEIYTQNYRYKIIIENNSYFLLTKPYLKEDLRLDLGHTIKPLECIDWAYVKEFIL